MVYRPGLGSNETCALFAPLPPYACVYYTYTPKPDATQVRFQGNFGPIAGRIRLGMDATYNLSPAGVYVRTLEPLEMGTAVELALALPTAKEMISVSADVLRPISPARRFRLSGVQSA